MSSRELKQRMAALREELHRRAPKTVALAKRDKQIVELCREGVSTDDIAVRFGLTRERVRQVLKDNGIKPPRKKYTFHS